MLQDIEHHKRDRETVLLDAINSRLATSFRSYCEDLTYSYEYLERRNNKNVMKKLNRLYK